MRSLALAACCCIHGSRELAASGSDNFIRVAENPPDDDGSCIASDTLSDRDMYAVAPLAIL